MTPRPRRLAIAGALLAALALPSAPMAADADTADTTASTAAHPSRLSLQVYRERVGSLGTVGGVPVAGDGFGSAVAAVPGRSDQVYGLTDRGPNVDGPDGSKIEPYPDFTPTIGRFRLRHGRAELIKKIPLRAKDGSRYNGRVNPDASTAEVITDVNGTVLPASVNGYDSEGLVALRDGTFWVSDEYGPFLTHFSKRGRAIERLSPGNGGLPAELARRTVNRGMEGLTLTPDGKTLVGVMQSALGQADSTVPAKSVGVVRIVTVDLRSRATHEYAYGLDNPAVNLTAVSEISALSATRFVLVERDGAFDPGAYKRLWQVDVSDATDLGPAATVGTYDDTNGGLRVDGRTVEAIAGGGDATAVTAALAAAGITAGTKSLYLDLGALVSSVSADGTFFAHDKIEGLAILRGGRRILISNDSDFGIAGSTSSTPPFGLVAKQQPDGTVDRGEFLVLDRE